jgi:hypothetical protein
VREGERRIRKRRRGVDKVDDEESAIGESEVQGGKDKNVDNQISPVRTAEDDEIF